MFAFVLVFAPYYLHSHDLWKSLCLAIPIFPIAMCTFIVNDINDIERDAINHPLRPLPSGEISVRSAAAIYTLLFATSLILIKFLIDSNVQYIYLLAFIISINYSTIVNYLPTLKNPYVALASLTPFGIVNSAARQLVVPLEFMLGAFLFILGREMLMDVRDRQGDGQTLIKTLPGRVGVIVAFSLQAMGVIVLSPLTTTLLRILVVMAIGLMSAIAIVLWRFERYRRGIISLMPVQMLLAVALLF